MKPENLLFSDNFVLKIVDFGFATPLEGRDGSGMNKTVLGTGGYMAPEIIEQKPYYALEADVFALGVILFIMRSADKPFGLARESDLKFYNLYRHRSELFWSDHQKGREEGFYSDDF